MSDRYGHEVVCVFIMLAIFGLIVTAIRVANQDPNDSFQRRVRKVTYEGHEYIYLIYDRGVCHSPECKCQTKGDVNEQ